ncbi:MAG: D-alanyl-D-alanine carboxypeptidase [Treponema sp.]|nr:D-alanyl-D-alanine carboxypeptidase [Treponema sp.]
MDKKKSTAQRSGRKAKKGPNKFLLIFLILILAYVISVTVTVKNTLNVKPLGSRTEAQEKYLEQVLDQKFPERTSIELYKSPFEIEPDDLSMNAESAIIIDVATGEILYEKDADLEIPPASMTKIVEMYVVLDAVENGLVSLDDTVPLPSESWEENIPWDASRMHLAKGQKVTLRELLLGLAICSGNDASVAVATYISGSMDSFVARMNEAVESMGLTKTSFVESSGYSEENMTTAREFATFARQYIKRFPYALEEFHSQPKIRYPEQKNMPEGKEAVPYTQQNTNKLLDEIPGCDGLKTGYIDESGYNISVTAEQNGTRFLSVTMGGPGMNMIEGNKYRVEDNKRLFDFAFENFADYHAPKGENSHEYTRGIFGGKENAVKLVPALDETFAVPILADPDTEKVQTVTTEVSIPDYLFGRVECGTQYGTISYKSNGVTLRTIPLVADRTVEAGNIFSMFIGKSAAIAAKLFPKKTK